MHQILHIEPAPSVRGHAWACRGTKVLLPDGTQVGGVTRVEIVGCVNDVWRAVLHVNVTLGGLSVDAVWAPSQPLSRWRRALLWLAGVRIVEDTSLDDDARHFRRVDGIPEAPAGELHQAGLRPVRSNILERWRGRKQAG